ncbi:hypothetical protein [Microbacterium cremeum]|uniref:hypothetical protein n=1 Tax=Microbacterium cremeum TaxID=2782169 RepID=UPI001887A929|nr:hypothetical protein [Microbacterium cremeum]
MRTARTVIASVVVGIGLVMTLAACTAPGPLGGVPTSGPLAVHPRVDAGMDALLEGTLRPEGDCVRVVHGQGVEAVPSFPAGDASFADGVLTWRGDDYRDGDPISLGGGFASADAGYVPEACRGHEVFIVSPF